MKLTYLHIKNFKSIRDLRIEDVQQALILVGKNNTGKTNVLDAIRAVAGNYVIRPEDFNEKKQNIEIMVTLEITTDDLHLLHEHGMISTYKRFQVWRKDVESKLPALVDHCLSFNFIANWQGKIRYEDGQRKHNRYLKEIFPKVYDIDTRRNLRELQNDVLLSQEDEDVRGIRYDNCIFASAKSCSHCYRCIGLLNQKRGEELNAHETAKLLEYKLYNRNLTEFQRRLNENFRKNGGYEEIQFSMKNKMNQLLEMEAIAGNQRQGEPRPLSQMSKGMRNLYMLSLLETYAQSQKSLPCMILVEEPEAFLHPQLQKEAGEILFRLSKKNQVMFTTHSPNMLPNFHTKEICQVVLDEDYYSVVRKNSDIDVILDDLGYSAADFMNVNFVFIVEGKQDKSRLPLLLKKYYSDIKDDEGHLKRISILTTNSCTNIKTYANLKYMNQLYLRDQFLMIRDGDGKDPQKLAGQLCQYYEQSNRQDVDHLPRVTRENVLILKYYSFENYFFNPRIMAQLGVVESEESFYEILFEKWKEYLHRLVSGRHLTEIMGRDFTSPEDMRAHMEEIKTYLRGHNLYDLFYGRYKKEETSLLTKYLELAPREDFKDILDSIDQFVYFESRKRK